MYEALHCVNFYVSKNFNVTTERSVNSAEREVGRTVQVNTSKNTPGPFFLRKVQGGIKGTHKCGILYLCFKTGNKFTPLYYWKRNKTEQQFIKYIRA
jgi:hypothetical protein